VKTCKSCNKFKKCVSLCASVEEYVNQDFVTRSDERYMSEIGKNIDSFKEDEFKDWFGTVTPEKELVYRLYMQGKSVDEIAYHITLSVSQIYRIIQGWKSSIIDDSYNSIEKRVLRLHFLDRMGIASVAQATNLALSTVHRLITSHLTVGKYR